MSRNRYDWPSIYDGKVAYDADLAAPVPHTELGIAVSEQPQLFLAANETATATLITVDGTLALAIRDTAATLEAGSETALVVDGGP